ncbi:MFS transporter [Pseudonocardia phyllosphaerae]|uniref:MFS transporter n=1 Tax=Pseudonocardia phyllosphaerae TaxID=3390502 RepID=UPI00397E6F98
MRRRLYAATFAGTVLEWYDFFIYGLMAGLVLNKLFFSGLDPSTALLASFGTFAAGFVARPLGGIVFGGIADRLGRKPALVASMAVVGVASVGIGALPTYAAAGAAAPILLTLLRFAHGLAIGGEWGSAASLLNEHAPPGRKARYTVWVQFGSSAGSILASVSMILMTGLLTSEQLLSWGWRIPFLVSVGIVAIGLYIRRSLPESPEFERVREQAPVRTPLREVLRDNYRQVVTVACLHTTQASITYLLTWTVAYTTGSLGMAAASVLTLKLLGGIAAMPIYLVVRIADRVGAARVYLVGSIASAAIAFPMFWLLQSRVLVLVFVAYTLANGVLYGLYCVQGKYYPEMFDVRYRATAASLGVQLGSIAAGLVPLIAVSLTTWSGGASWPVSLYMVGTALLGVVAVLYSMRLRPATA